MNKYFQLLFVFCILSCGTPTYNVNSTLDNKLIKTTVDSELAKYHLEHYIQNENPIPKKDERNNNRKSEFDGKELNRQTLNSLSKQPHICRIGKGPFYQL
jgi:hypothetical protein|tara:strand:+ start:592 stop:891 length:300 start_codon:yes stop_codon:yes gene_type:complete